MKWITSFVFVLSAQLAHAIDFDCVNQVSPETTEYTRVSSWPRVLVSISQHSCSPPDANGESMCSIGIKDEIATPFQVCFRQVDTDKDCKITETSSLIAVSCNADRTVMTFNLDQNGHGEIRCTEDQIQRKTWNVGLCTRK
ncbi:hypothetical protein [Bdellovibrio sp. HCB337]|uniref:hypothetical protein n=1 Tax=Bdellovibrio sp. HCB337 TaxID=3394358 RepID=UPI0039A698A7